MMCHFVKFSQKTDTIAYSIMFNGVSVGILHTRRIFTCLNEFDKKKPVILFLQKQLFRISL